MDMVKLCSLLLPYVTRINGFSLDSIRKVENVNLQAENVSLNESRGYFDLLLENSPELENRYEPLLTKQEKLELKDFVLDDENTGIMENLPTSMKDKVALKRKRKNTKYMDLGIINPTSNVLERLFSAVKYYYTDWRK
ncbi:hypothetical protein BB559_005969 [Furculomyces boomerangus]|uniref:Uncharacterized protein n=1 Tax=Furculomyces boomerangus TaxID=61424 RepID=A0A2T9Y5P1_9FUNG|nr:hypothetical protein BB559_005969 [Furculomyces boomerangus]